MNSIAIFFLLFVSCIFGAQVLNIGGTTCIPADLDGNPQDSCTPYTGSEMVTVTGGVNVDDSNECAAGTADTMGISSTFTIDADTFAYVTLNSYGVDQTVLIFSGDVTEDGCEADYTVAESWTGYIEAGEYTVIVTPNNGAEDACGEFSLTVGLIEYDLTGVTDTLTGAAAEFVVGFCTYTAPQWAAFLTYTPTESGAYLGSGVGRQGGEDVGANSALFIIPTAMLPSNLTSKDEWCNATDYVISYNLTSGGYDLVADVEYTIAVFDADTDGDDIDVFFNFWMVVEEEPTVCDTMYADQNTFMRPSLPALSTTAECEEGTSEYTFDLTHLTNGETDQFIVVDTLNCDDSDQGSDFDQAIVIYYDHVGTERDGDTPAEAPEDACENFILAGDSGDGGAVYYWFPAEADFTAVPTTYGSSQLSEDGVFNLEWNSYDIAGCVPENPFIPVEVPDSDNAVLAAVTSIFFFLALF